MENDTKPVAEQLHDWFGSVLRLSDDSLFSIVPDGPHRDAVVLDVLKRNGRRNLRWNPEERHHPV